MEIRAVETDADYEAWRQVRIAVLPHERCPSVAELRELETPHRLLLLAERDGTVVGQRIVGSVQRGRSWIRGAASASRKRGGRASARRC